MVNKNWDNPSKNEEQQNKFDKGRTKTSNLAFCCVNTAKLCSPLYQTDGRQTYLFWTEDIAGGVVNFFPNVKTCKFTKNLQVDHVPNVTQFPVVEFTLEQQGQIEVYNKSCLGLQPDQIVQFLLVSANGLELLPEIILLIGKLQGLYMPINVQDSSLKIKILDGHQFTNLKQLIVYKVTKKIVGDTNQNVEDINIDFLKNLFDIHPEKIERESVISVKEQTALEKLGDYFDV